MATILLVEDNPGDQRLFQEALKEEGLEHQLITAISANQCIEIMYHQKPDVIVMDIHISGVPGTDFVLLLQKNSMMQFVPVIFLTGTQELFSESFDDIVVGDSTYPRLAKPVDSKQLKAALAKALQEKKF